MLILSEKVLKHDRAKFYKLSEVSYNVFWRTLVTNVILRAEVYVTELGRAINKSCTCIHNTLQFPILIVRNSI